MSDATPALMRWWPELAEHLPHLPLGHLPTPTEELSLPSGARLWIKRDDLSGQPYGGNKTRKLEFLLADALDRGCEAVWTLGAIGSHHALATALYAQQAGLETHILHFPQPLTGHVRDILLALSTLESASVTLLRRRNLLPMAMLSHHIKMRQRYGDKIAYIPAGGSNPVGALGFVNAALELAEQVEAGALPEPARIYVPMGSGGTFCGLWIGCRLAGLKTEVVGVRVVDLVACNKILAARLIRKTSALLCDALPTLPRFKPAAGDLSVHHTHFGAGYGVPSDEGRAAAAIFSKMGHGLDPTYTAKTAAAMLDGLDRGESHPVLFWQTLSSADMAALISEGDKSRLPDTYTAFFEEGPTPDLS